MNGLICPAISNLLADIPFSPLLLIIVLAFAGVLLLGVDFFVLPGFFIGDIFGAIALLAAAIIAGMAYGVMWGITVFLLSALLSFAGLLLGMKTNLIKKRFVLSTVQKHGQGTQAEDFSQLVGQRGVAITALRPAGSARINNRRTDVVSEGGYVEAGTRITVVLVEGPRVVVKISTDTPQATDLPELNNSNEHHRSFTV
ncbi:MAG: NfeD family protein [Deltaproteobacteria bacterium]|nr:NfeD family protein [Deltaproteobacteria bacterium]